MAQFAEHIQQAKDNLDFLEFINTRDNKHCDWQVTVCFYTALHLINAHLSLFHMQYRKHVDVKDAINPRKLDSIQQGSALPEAVYLAYMKLQSLSRRSRYLVNEKDGNLQHDQAYLTYDIHLSRALRHLNTIINFFSKKYTTEFIAIKMKCEGINKGELSFVKD